jgi:hypothetical protein
MLYAAVVASGSPPSFTLLSTLTGVYIYKQAVALKALNPGNLEHQDIIV